MQRIDKIAKLAAKIVIALALVLLAGVFALQADHPALSNSPLVTKINAAIPANNGNKAPPAGLVARSDPRMPGAHATLNDTPPAVATGELAKGGYPIKSVLTLDGPLGHGDAYWDESAAPADGPMLITVDLAAQTLSVFRDGHEIGVAVIMYGADEKPTPLGVYPITEKDADHVSNLYGAPMPYMLRMTNDGVSIHGSDVEYGYATHGCIGVPTSFAKKLFAAVRLGDPIVVTEAQTIKAGDAVHGI